MVDPSSFADPETSIRGCLFCYKHSDEKTLNQELGWSPVMQRSLLLLSRYLSESLGNIPPQLFSLVRKRCEIKAVATCQDCTLLLHEFCTLFDQIRCLEMKLNWRVKILHDIMKSADRIPTRVNIFRNRIMLECWGNESGTGILGRIKELRKEIMEQCVAKLNSTYPKICLKRCRSGGEEEGMCVAPIQKRVKIEIQSPPLQEAPQLLSGDIKTYQCAENEQLPPEDDDEYDVTQEDSVHSPHVPDDMSDFEETTRENEEENDDISPQVRTSSSLSLKQLCWNKLLLKSYHCSFKSCKHKKIRFLNKSDLQNHSRLHGRFNCNFCGVVKKYAPDLFTHELKHKTERSKSCPRCPYKKSGTLWKHYLKCHWNLVGSRHTCHICSGVIGTRKKEGTRQDFQDHFQTHHDVKLTIAKKCGMDNCSAYFKTNAQLNSHSLTVHRLHLSQRRKHVCEDCGKPCESEADLEDHRPKHITGTEFKFKCKFPGCHKYFISQKRRSCHKMRCHAKKFPCPKCRKLVNARRMQYHLKICKFNEAHSWKQCDEMMSAKQVYCKICGKEFYNDGDLQNHTQLHGEFKCEFCDVTVSFASELPVHETKCYERPEVEEMKSKSTLVCSRCTLTGDDEATLISHFVEEHLKLKMDRHTCSICSYEFKRKKELPSGDMRQTLVKHFRIFHDLKVASGESYECEEDNCSAYFLTKLQLKKHKDSIHDDSGKLRNKLFECLDCGNKRFQRILALENHRRRKHQDCEPEADEHDDEKEDEELSGSENLTSTPILDIPLDLTVDENVNRKSSLGLKELCLNELLGSSYFCNVPTCKDKGRLFINANDLQKHARLHGKFKCNFCEVEEKYAPDLLAHETKVHSKQKNATCPRCSYQNSSDGILLKHYLKSHWNMLSDRDTCHICSEVITPSKDESERRNLFHVHYQTHHQFDLTTVKKCGIGKCLAYFNTSSQLDKHQVTVHKLSVIGKHVCEDCGKSFESEASLQDHQLKHRDGAEFKEKCFVCTKFFENKKDRTIHKERCHSGKIPCLKCNKMVFRGRMDYHLLVCTHIHKDLSRRCGEMVSEKHTLCKKCGKEFYNDVDLDNHTRLHGEFPCKFCSIKVSFASELPIHETKCCRPEVDQSALACSRCAFTGEDEPGLISHFVEKHLKLKMDSHTCFVCSAEFKSKTTGLRKGLIQHFQVFHDPGKVAAGQIYKCEEDNCSAYFVTKLQRTKHRNVHQVSGKYKIVEFDPNNKKFECVDCGKRFRNARQVRQHHERIHENVGERPFPCTTGGCNLRFTTQAELDTHLGDTDLVRCPKCDKSFHGKFGLGNHLLTHLPVNPRRANLKKNEKWQCDKCGKSLSSKEALERHKFVHSGMESWEFQCEMCSKKCLTKQKLNEHMRTHCQEKPFVCDICGVKYAHRHNLRHHMNNKHTKIMPKSGSVDKTSKKKAKS